MTAIGVWWGIFMLVLLLGFGGGLKNGVDYQFKDDFVNSIWLRQGSTSIPYQGLPTGRRISFDNSDYDYLKNEFDGIEDMSGRYYLSGSTNVKYNNKSLSFNVRSVHPGHRVIENTIVIQGRYLNDKDISNFNKVAVIGKIVRDNLFDQEDPIGQEISINNIVYTVIGVFRDTGGEWEMRNIYIPISTAQKIYEGTDRIHQLIITGGDKDLDEMTKLEKEVWATMASRKQFDPADRRAMSMFNLAREYDQIQGLLRAINFIVWTVGIFSIIAGVIGVSNIMLIIVKDRTREIGIRKAIGANPRSIVSMILQESISLTAIAGFLGLAVGILVLHFAGTVESEYFRNPSVDLGLVITATIILILAGAIAGLIPARRAAKVHPVEAMKDV
jgi:putative ABC transport system permease protein